jgi:D-glycero-D-manno-heptose 1,7-bisphosphate phosphatase
MLHHNKAVFFDRDGVINKRIIDGYVTKWDEFEWLPDVGETLQVVKAKKYLAIIITNQRGVGIGKMSEADLDTIHATMQAELLEKYGVEFDDIISCTDATNDSPRRKPSPAMLFEAQAKWNIDLSKSWFIGDSPSDIEAGLAAGTRTVFLLNEHETPHLKSTITISHLLELPDLL